MVCLLLWTLVYDLICLFVGWSAVLTLFVSVFTVGFLAVFTICLVCLVVGVCRFTVNYWR